MKQFILLCFLLLTASLLLAQSVPTDTVKTKRSLFKHKKHKQEATWTPYCSSCEITQFDPETYFKDDDADGVFNVFDLQLNTPALAPVDSNGVAVDSDGDGVLDFEDAEPNLNNKFEIESYLDNDIEFEQLRFQYIHTKEFNGEMCLPLIMFEIDSFLLTPFLKPDLNQLVALSNRYTKFFLELDGSIDSGYEKNNPEIGNKRMFTVAEYLLDMGMNENKIAVIFNDFNNAYTAEIFNSPKRFTVYASVSTHFVRYFSCAW